ncbi:50S ribosomal protein L10 [Candidatus Saccharibacteria bacterium]|nr:50S ribosomal protein L10 [Candidatus Saccharibacteria bacterium]
MAITKDQKQALVAKMKDAFASAKSVAFAQYAGLGVADLQELRSAARDAGVRIIVVKNRLVRVAMGESASYKETDTSLLEGQLLYAFSDTDEVMASKVLDAFAKNHADLKLAGGFSSEGAALAEAEVKALASLPGKDQLIAEVVAQLLSPVHDTTNALSGNLHALLDGIEAKATH